MFLRTRKQKSKIDFALLDKSNKMVSGVKLILTKQNPRRLNKAQRLCIKTTTTTKQLQRLYTPKELLCSAPPLYGTQRRRTRDSHKGKKHGCDGSSPASCGTTDTTIYTMDTELHWCHPGRRSPWALPVTVLPALGCGCCQGPSSHGAGAEHSRFLPVPLFICPSIPPSFCPCVRLPLPSAPRRLLCAALAPGASPPAVRGHCAVRGGKRVPRSCCAGVPCGRCCAGRVCHCPAAIRANALPSASHLAP